MNRQDAFQNVCNCGFEIFVQKNKGYGDSISETGVIGAVTEICAKTARLRELVLRNSEHGAQDIRAVLDSLVDLHNYSNIGVMMLEEGNWVGKDQED